MSIPDYQSFMLPFLELAGDGKEHTIQEMYKKLSDSFHLTDDEMKELLPSGKQLTYKNRIAWVSTYLKKAYLIKSSGRGRFYITKRGLAVLQEKPDAINVKYLKRFEEFQEFHNPTRSQDVNDPVNKPSDEGILSPEETLEKSYADLKRSIMSEVLEIVKGCSPEFFEGLVVDLLVSMGYGGSRLDAGRAIGKSGDEGIDGIIDEDRLGLDIIYIQAKKWENPVGRPTVQAFAGSLEGQRARKGILITTSRFTDGAHEYVDKIEKKIVLIDGERLADLMFEFNVGISNQDTYIVKSIDTDYFAEE